MHNVKYQCHMAAHTAYQLSSPSCSTKAMQKSLTLSLYKKKMVENFLQKSHENRLLADK